jgi:hypothetical protein
MIKRTMVWMACLALLPAVATAAAPRAAAETGYRQAVMVNHVAIDIAASPDAVWRSILDHYVAATKFREQGTVTPVDDPAYPLGGYRLRLGSGAALDERLVHFTERDEAARRLSLVADYLTYPGGLKVFATYQAEARPGGARFTIDCHSQMGTKMPAGGPAALAAQLAAGKAEADKYLIDFLKRVKAELEAKG